MSRSLMVFGSAALVFTFGLAVHGHLPSAQAQSGSLTQQGSGQRQAAPAQEAAPFEARFWTWLSQSRYQNWGPLPGNPGDTYPSEAPHGDRVKLFANRTAAANPDSLPSGSVIVKENYGADGTTLAAVTVMYRSQGYNPEGGDWFWAMYGADGSVSMMDGMPIAGRVGMCIDCHRSADGGDLTFANDK